MIYTGLTSAAHHPAAQDLGAEPEFLGLLKSRPPTCDYLTPLGIPLIVPPPALGNDTAPDCVEAGYLWAAAARERTAMGSTWLPGASEALRLLPVWGNVNTGTDLAAAQRAAAVSGVPIGTLDLDVVLPARVPLDWHMMRTALWVYGAVGLCWNLPAFIGDMPDAELWDVRSGPGTEPGGLGLHYTSGLAYDSGTVQVVSWGFMPRVTPAFAAMYLVGVAAQLSRRWFDTLGRSPPGFDWAQADAMRARMG